MSTFFGLFAIPLDVVSPKHIRCCLVKCQYDSSPLWGVVVGAGQGIEKNSRGLNLFSRSFKQEEDSQLITIRSSLRAYYYSITGDTSLEHSKGSGHPWRISSKLL